ncbi:hypothetical protein EGW08_020292 [Elysia chlorotica]|uniref:Uncharacterized protein n=1 Tax=Elysia chlorotica TaxID=188477 RepID=A0A433SRQ0_ELYCH|nr:hypothetical protein EGW08_020292 [Elysia chlorotica]
MSLILTMASIKCTENDVAFRLTYLTPSVYVTSIPYVSLFFHEVSSKLYFYLHVASEAHAPASRNFVSNVRICLYITHCLIILCLPITRAKVNYLNMTNIQV